MHLLPFCSQNIHAQERECPHPSVRHIGHPVQDPSADRYENDSDSDQDQNPEKTVLLLPMDEQKEYRQNARHRISHSQPVLRIPGYDNGWEHAVVGQRVERKEGLGDRDPAVVQEHHHDRQQNDTGHEQPDEGHHPHVQKRQNPFSDCTAAQEKQPDHCIQDGQERDDIEKVKIADCGDRRDHDEQIGFFLSQDLLDPEDHQRKINQRIQKIRMPRCVDQAPLAEAVAYGSGHDSVSVLKTGPETEF